MGARALSREQKPLPHCGRMNWGGYSTDAEQSTTRTLQPPSLLSKAGEGGYCHYPTEDRLLARAKLLDFFPVDTSDPKSRAS